MSGELNEVHKERQMLMLKLKDSDRLVKVKPTQNRSKSNMSRLPDIHNTSVDLAKTDDEHLRMKRGLKMRKSNSKLAKSTLNTTSNMSPKDTKIKEMMDKNAINGLNVSFRVIMLRYLIILL